MFLLIDNAPRDYAWGSRTAIADHLGRTASGEPEAELWLGSHPGSPSVVSEPDVTPGTTLDAYLESRGQPQLGFLLKVLAAAGPLSLQVHPTTEQARDGFARENAAGIPLDAPHRNYRDASAKPELIMALADGFEALSGFRELSESLTTLRNFSEAATAVGDEVGAAGLVDFALRVAQHGLAAAATFALTDSDARVVTRAVVDVAQRETSKVDARDRETVIWLAQEFGADPGILISLLLHRVTLRAGEALFLGAGNVHAYLRGIGIEVMAASDNVLRGGLTSKHVDVPELLRVASWEPLAAPVWPATPEGPGVVAFRPPVDDFVLFSVSDPEPSAAVVAHGPGIVLALDGALAVAGSQSHTVLERGEALYVSADEFPLTFTGRGRAVVATG
ncbi:MAG: mannose-6-phosphate isomerase, class I [Aurantimicrobium sp.]|jgi:mannose-6-phosphate isomerase|nr:mannose-6-phosphate isomerase, class I [Aurantimicrobium sp.]